MKENPSTIPITDNCILTFHLDFEKGKKHIIMGELPKVRQYLQGYKQANILAEKKREIGTVVQECFQPMSKEIADVRIGLAEGLGKNMTPMLGTSLTIVEKLYQSENICYRFLAVRLWSEYRTAKAVYIKRKKGTEVEEYITMHLLTTLKI